MLPLCFVMKIQLQRIYTYNWILMYTFSGIPNPRDTGGTSRCWKISKHEAGVGKFPDSCESWYKILALLILSKIPQSEWKVLEVFIQFTQVNQALVGAVLIVLWS